MFFRAWVYAAAFGLVFLPCLGQAQEQAQSPGGQIESQQAPTDTSQFSIPVEIIENQAAAEARERREKEAEQREIDDLIAQEGMNAATQSIEAATRDMRDYALYSTIIVGIGTVLLVGTLWLTWQANRAAVAAVEASNSFNRPWISVDITIRPNTESVQHKGFLYPGSASFSFIVKMKNVGRSPAYVLLPHLEMMVPPQDAEEVEAGIVRARSMVGRDNLIKEMTKVIFPEMELVEEIGASSRNVEGFSQANDRTPLGVAAYILYGDIYGNANFVTVERRELYRKSSGLKFHVPSELEPDALGFVPQPSPGTYSYHR